MNNQDLTHPLIRNLPIDGEPSASRLPYPPIQQSNDPEFDPAQVQEPPPPNKISNKTRTIIMAIFDVMGTMGFITYCVFLQTYLSTFYLLMMLLILNFMWYKIPRGVGFYANEEKTMMVPLNEFVRTLKRRISDNSATYRGTMQSTSSLDVSLMPSNYKPLYWLIFKDITKFLWIAILVVSTIFLVVKIVFYVLLYRDTANTLALMSTQNFYGLEIFFTQPDPQTDPNNISFTPIDYIKTFLPNAGILVFSIVALFMTRIDSKVNLETYNFEINSKVFKFYIIMVWFQLAILISSSNSVQGYVFLLLQVLLTLKIFYNQKSPNKIEIFSVNFLKIYLYILITGLYAFGTPQAASSQEDFQSLSYFLGLELIPQIRQLQWQAIVFLASSLVLFLFLCLLTQQMQYETRRQKLLPAIKRCVEWRDEFLILQRHSQHPEEQQDIEAQEPVVEQQVDLNDEELIVKPSGSLVDRTSSQRSEGQHLLETITLKVTHYADKLRATLDSPIVTLRFVQIAAILVIILQKTYYSIVLSLWVFGTGFTLDMKYNFHNTLILGIPSVFVNLVTQMYANIPGVGSQGNAFNVCEEEVVKYDETPTTQCGKLGFYRDNSSEINVNTISYIIQILFMDIVICAFFLLLKQIKEYEKSQLKQQRKKQEHLHFMSKKKEKSNDLSLVPYSTILIALIFKISYIVSLLILFWVGFHEVNILQFILVLFLLIFLINDSQRSVYTMKKKPKQVSGETINPVEKQILVPFAFKYWWLLVGYVELMIFTRYIYQYFFTNDNTNLYLEIIGIDSGQYYEILFWFLFYFVALQYDAYRSKVYIKYSGRVLECIMAKPIMAKCAPSYKNHEGLLYLSYLRFIIWVSFAVNLGFLLFTAFSFINTFLLVIVGSIFCYYVSSLIEGVNYNRMKQLWYIYLHILVLAFIVRYAFQFLCIPESSQIESAGTIILKLYETLQTSYQEFGFYEYDPSNPNFLRVEYFADMITIFLGALSLNTFQIFSTSQDIIKFNAWAQASRQTNFHADRRSSASQVSQGEESLQGHEGSSNLLEQKRVDDTREIARLMNLSILDEWKFAKTPILIFANINTDVVTIIVVIVAVFVTQSIAIWLIMVCYLRYYLLVHNHILKLLQEKSIIVKLNTKIEHLKTKYLGIGSEFGQRVSNTFATDETDIKRLVEEIKLTRLETRISVKKNVGKWSFYFTAFCVFLTYASLSLTDSFGKEYQGADWWKYLNYSFFVFGTYATQTLANTQCFCGTNAAPVCEITDIVAGHSKSNIFSNVWFFLLLIIVNVIDFMCTQILMEDLRQELEKFNDQGQPPAPPVQGLEQAVQEPLTIMSVSQVVDRRQAPLQPIKEEEEKEKLEESKEKIELEEQVKEVAVQDEASIVIHDFEITHNYIQFNHEENKEKKERQHKAMNLSESGVDEMTLRQLAQKYTYLIQYFKNKDLLLGITYQQAFFKMIQRILILLFLLNTVLVNNIFSLFYLAVASYLFLCKPNYSGIKNLNTTSIFAIFFQYLLLLLNLGPKSLQFSDLPAKIIPMKTVGLTSVTDETYFSVIQRIGLKNPYDLSYLGFSNGDLEDCEELAQSSLFSNQPCETNDRLNWVFILNTLVLSMIYVYFLIFEILVNSILKSTKEMEKGMFSTEQVILMQLRNDPNAKIIVNYPSWKGRLYTQKNSLYEAIVRNGHLLLAGLILLIAQADHLVFNLVEVLLILVFYLIVEIIFDWPYQKSKHSFLISYFRVLFYVPIVAIFCFTALKEPVILGWCIGLKAPLPPKKASVPLIDESFICSQIFNIEITGMIFIMFFISLYFDLMNSPEHQQSVKNYTQQSLLKARMISKSLAYASNHQKYKEILYEQQQKNIFREIQSQIMERLKLWHRRMKDQQGGQNENERPEDQSVVLQESVPENQVESLGEVAPMEKSEKPIEYTATQGILVSGIMWLQKNNDYFKFMGMSNLLDYILAQNQVLERHVYITVEDYIKEDYTVFRRELDVIDAFYYQLFKKIGEKNEITNDLIDEVVQEILPDQQAAQQKELEYIMSQSVGVQQAARAIKKDNIRTFTDYRKDKELAYVHIVDQRLTFCNTKIYAQEQDFLQYKTWGLVNQFLKQFCRYLISNWSVLCFIMFILYYCKNHGLLGGFLPVLLFMWVIIEEGEAPKIFWTIALIFIAIIMSFILLFTQEGVGLLKSDSGGTQTSWWYPLYTASGDGMIFESILIWMIVIQLFLQKKWGVFNQSIAQVENIFKGYVRMKINRVGVDSVKPEQNKNVVPVPRRSSALRTVSEFNEKSSIQQPQEQKDERSKSHPNNKDIVPQIKTDYDMLDEQIIEYDMKDTQRVHMRHKVKNRFEERIKNQPELLNTNVQFTFFQRTFGSKFAKPGRDLYAIVASIQLLIFVYLLLFFTSMTRQSNGISDIIKLNQIPGGLVGALIAHVILMVFERYVTLRTPYVNEERKEYQQMADKQSKEKQYLVQRDDISVSSEDSKKLTSQVKSQADKFGETYRVQFLIKFALQGVILTLVYWFVFLHLGKPYVKFTKAINTDITQINTDSNQESKQENFTTGTSITIFFLIYCTYFYYGYRELKLRNTFLESYTQPAYIYGKTFYAIPFLFELKVLMDWTFLQTSLDVFQWFKLEDIHGLMYFSKIQSKNYQERKVGERIPSVMKCGMGCSLVTFILICIFAPLLLFSTLNPATELNLVNGGDILITLFNNETGLKVPLYSSNQIYGLNEIVATSNISHQFNYSVTNQIITSANDNGALQQIQAVAFSNQNWGISIPLLEQLLSQLNDTINIPGLNSYFFFQVEFLLSREKAAATPITNIFKYPNNPLLQQYYGNNESSLTTKQLEQIYDNILNCAENTLDLYNFYVQTVQIYTTDGTNFKPRPVTGGVNAVQNMTTNLNCGKDSRGTLTNQTSWWQFNYAGDSLNINNLPSQQGMMLFVVSDKYSSITSGFSIITIYTSVILLIGTFIRSLFNGQVFLLEFTDMLKPDDLLMICQAISIARTQKDFVKENLLYFELIDILRSPEIVKVMTGSWSETFKKKYIQDRVEEERSKLKAD